MKKFFKWFLVLLLALVAILMVLPLAFQGKISQMAKEEINNNINAQVDFDQVSISFLSAFPNVSLKMKDLSVIGKDDFSGDTLAYLEQFQVKVGLMSILSEPIEIKSIIINRPSIYVKVLKDGTANWDIAKETETVVEEESTSDESNMTLSLQEFKINSANIIYDDRGMDVYTNIQNMDFRLHGNLSADFTSLYTQTNIEALSLKMNGVPYFNKAEMELHADLDADLKNSKYTFKENQIKINELELGFDGSITMPNDDIALDMSFEAKQTAFKHILSLVPTVYMNDFQDIKTAGELSLKGSINGIYNENRLPAFSINLLVDNAMFQYPDLPSKVENIGVNLHIQNKDGVEDHTIINLKKFHMDMAGNPFDMKVLLQTPFSDPNIDGRINGTIDLGKMKDILPSEDMKMSGIISTNVEMKGRVSSIEKEDYEAFHALGNIELQNLNYSDEDLPQGIDIKSAKAIISPQFVEIHHFRAQIGQSDMNMKGKIENFLAYYFNDDLLKGRFSFISNKIDMIDLMGKEAAEIEEAEETSTEEMSLIEIPNNIDFTLNTEIKELHYDNIYIKNIKGGLVLKDGMAIMQHLNMNLLDGSLKMNGKYSTQDIEKPIFDFNFDAVDFDVKQSFETLNTIQKLAPIAKHTQGKISVNMELNGVLLPNMDPDLTTINGKGRLQSNTLSITNADLFKQVGALIKTDKFNQFSLTNVDATFKIENGDLSIKPFETKIGKSKMIIGGSQSLDQSIDYSIKFIIPSSELGSQANAVANQLFSEMGKFGVDLNAPENIKFKALVGGTLTDPKVSLDLKNAAGNMADNLKKQAAAKLKEEKEKAKKKAIAEAKKQAAFLMAEADNQGKKLIKEANKIANLAKKEANKQADAAKAEAYKQADALIVEAGSDTMKKLLAKTAADKIKAEASKTAESFKKEAAKQANMSVNEAKKQSRALKEKAQKEGDALIARAEKV